MPEGTTKILIGLLIPIGWEDVVVFIHWKSLYVKVSLLTARHGIHNRMLQPPHIERYNSIHAF